jgi:hypothetical protein
VSERLRVDHLVYGVPDLDGGIAQIEAWLGVRAVHGGSHPGRGTRNALLGLGPRTYLEIIAPDPEQSRPPSWFGVGHLSAPRLVTWAAPASDLEAQARAASAAGIPLGEIISGSRERTDGVELRWRYTDPSKLIADGIVPFLIDWGTTQHPANAVPSGGTLVELRAVHPQPERVAKMLQALDIDMRVDAGARVAIVATIDGVSGPVQVR